MRNLKILFTSLIFLIAFFSATIMPLQCGSNQIENCKRCHSSKVDECSQCTSDYSLKSPGTTNSEFHATSCKEGSENRTIYIVAAIFVTLCILLLLILIPAVLWYKYKKNIQKWYNSKFTFKFAFFKKTEKKFEKKQLKKRQKGIPPPKGGVNNRKSPYVVDNDVFQDGTGSMSGRQSRQDPISIPIQGTGGYKMGSQNGVLLPPPQQQPQPQMKMMYGPTNYNQY